MIDSDSVVEAMIKDKGLTAPRVMPKAIDALVASLNFHLHSYPGTTVTVAIATLPNGFECGIGKSACASPENYNKEIGDKVAIDNARDAARQKLWELEGYVLKKQLSAPAPSFQDRVRLEKAELDNKIEKLHLFLCSPKLHTLPPAEQFRLQEQISAMQQYRDILDDRILNF